MPGMTAAPTTEDSAAAGAQQAVAEASRWSPATWWGLIKASLSAWLDDYAPSMGAALSYYTVFSLAPLLVIVVSLAGLVFGTEAVRGEVFGQIAGLMGAEAAKGAEDMLAAVSRPSTGAWGSKGPKNSARWPSAISSVGNVSTSRSPARSDSSSMSTHSNRTSGCARASSSNRGR